MAEKWLQWLQMKVSWKRGTRATPSHHPHFPGIFLYKPSVFWPWKAPWQLGSNVNYPWSKKWSLFGRVPLSNQPSTHQRVSENAAPSNRHFNGKYMEIPIKLIIMALSDGINHGSFSWDTIINSDHTMILNGLSLTIHDSPWWTMINRPIIHDYHDWLSIGLSMINHPMFSGTWCELPRGASAGPQPAPGRPICGCLFGPPAAKRPWPREKLRTVKVDDTSFGCLNPMKFNLNPIKSHLNSRNPI